MELKVCPNPCASASAAEFNVSPARRESSSKALFEPLEALKYRWVFPLPHRPSSGPLQGGTPSPSTPAGSNGTRVNLQNATADSSYPPRKAISSKQANARAFFVC